MAAPSDDRVDLTELDVITRYSLAVRTATADRSELIAALRNDLQWLERGRPSPPAPARKAAPRKAAPARKAAPRKAATTKTAARRAR